MSQWVNAWVFRPPLGWWPTVAIVGCGLAMWVWYVTVRLGQLQLGSRVVLGLMRLVAVVALSWVLCGPGVQTQRVSDGREAKVAVRMMIDASASMMQRDVRGRRGDGQPAVTRWDAAVGGWLERGYLRRLEALTDDLRLLRFDEEVESITPEQAATHTPEGSGTDLVNAIDRAIESMSGRAVPQVSATGGGVVVLISDGHDTRRGVGAIDLDRWRSSGSAVLSVPVGETSRTPDVAVGAWADAEQLLEDESTWITVTVSQTGFGRRRARVELWLDDRLIESATVEFHGATRVQHRFEIRPRVREGDDDTQHAYRVRASLVGEDVAQPSAAVHDQKTLGAMAPTQTPVDSVDTASAGWSEEVLTENNERWVFVQQSRSRLRVALLEGQPYWDSRFLARVLREDPAIDLTTVYALGTGRLLVSRSGSTQEHSSAGGPSGFESIEASGWLDRVDVLILGKRVERFFPGQRAQWLKDFVANRGGALVLARGIPFDVTTPAGRKALDAVQSVIPVRWGSELLGDLGLTLTESGRVSPLTDFGSSRLTDAVLTRLPDMLAATRIVQEKAASVVLVRQAAAGRGGGESVSMAELGTKSQGMAAVAYQHIGRGRVFAVLGDGLWKWAFLPSRQGQYDSIFANFWSRVIRWSAGAGEFLPGRSIAVAPSRLAANPGQRVEIWIHTRGYGPPQGQAPVVTVTAPGGRTTRLELSRARDQSGRFVASIVPDQVGVYRIRAVDRPVERDQATFEVEANGGVSETGGQVVDSQFAVYRQSVEQLDTGSRPDVLNSISAATGGQCLRLQDREKVVEYLESVAVAQQSDSRFSYAVYGPWVYGVVALTLGFEWWLRRRLAMP